LFPILLDVNKATNGDPTKTDISAKVMAESFFPNDEGYADRCYYIPGERWSIQSSNSSNNKMVVVVVLAVVVVVLIR